MTDHHIRSTAGDEARHLISQRNGIIRTAEALRIGIHPRTLYALRDTGDLEQISRGVYRLADRRAISNYDIVTVAVRVPRAVICLVSALAFHGITTQVPHTVSIALERGAEKTLADCFKFRNRIGMDVVLEALRLYKARKSLNVGELLKYAHICRVETVMRPYLEAML